MADNQPGKGRDNAQKCEQQLLNFDALQIETSIKTLTAKVKRFIAIYGTIPNIATTAVEAAMQTLNAVMPQTIGGLVRDNYTKVRGGSQLEKNDIGATNQSPFPKDTSKIVATAINKGLSKVVADDNSRNGSVSQLSKADNFQEPEPTRDSHGITAQPSSLNLELISTSAIDNQSSSPTFLLVPSNSLKSSPSRPPELPRDVPGPPPNRVAEDTTQESSHTVSSQSSPSKVFVGTNSTLEVQAVHDVPTYENVTQIVEVLPQLMHNDEHQIGDKPRQYSDGFAREQKEQCYQELTEPQHESLWAPQGLSEHIQHGDLSHAEPEPFSFNLFQEPLRRVQQREVNQSQNSTAMLHRNFPEHDPVDTRVLEDSTQPASTNLFQELTQSIPEHPPEAQHKQLRTYGHLPNSQWSSRPQVISRQTSRAQFRETTQPNLAQDNFESSHQSLSDSVREALPGCVLHQQTQTAGAPRYTESGEVLRPSRPVGTEAQQEVAVQPRLVPSHRHGRMDFDFSSLWNVSSGNAARSDEASETISSTEGTVDGIVIRPQRPLPRQVGASPQALCQYSPLLDSNPTSRASPQQAGQMKRPLLQPRSLARPSSVSAHNITHKSSLHPYAMPGIGTESAHAVSQSTDLRSHHTARARSNVHNPLLQTQREIQSDSPSKQQTRVHPLTQRQNQVAALLQPADHSPRIQMTDLDSGRTKRSDTASAHSYRESSTESLFAHLGRARKRSPSLEMIGSRPKVPRTGRVTTPPLNIKSEDHERYEDDEDDNGHCRKGTHDENTASLPPKTIKLLASQSRQRKTQNVYFGGVNPAQRSHAPSRRSQPPARRSQNPPRGNSQAAMRNRAAPSPSRAPQHNVLVPPNRPCSQPSSTIRPPHRQREPSEESIAEPIPRYRRRNTGTPAVIEAGARDPSLNLNSPRPPTREAAKRKTGGGYQLMNIRRLRPQERQLLEMRYCSRVACIIGSKSCVAMPPNEHVNKNIYQRILLRFPFEIFGGDLSALPSIGGFDPNALRDPSMMYTNSQDFVGDVKAMLQEYVVMGHDEECVFLKNGRTANARVMCWRMRLEPVVENKMREMGKCMKECEELVDAEDWVGKIAKVDGWFEDEEFTDLCP